MRQTTYLVGAAIIACAAMPASAAVVINTSPGAVQPAENVLFDLNQPIDMSVEGTTNQTDTNVTFESNVNLDVSGSSGQARIESATGPLDQLSVFLSDPMATFTEIEFNLFFANNDTDMVTISLFGTTGLKQTFNVGKGQNFFSAVATDGDVFTRVSFDSNGSGFRDARQFRIGGIDQMGAVPEPSTWMMMLLGFGALGFVMRREKSPVRGLQVQYS